MKLPKQIAIFFISIAALFLNPTITWAQSCIFGETCGFCGNEACEIEESFSSCPLDCEPSLCGDSRCDADETSVSCADDCFESACGDFRCDPDESATSCADDCGGCQSDTDCDDHNACTGTETCNVETGQCLSGTAVTCTALDQCHDVGACNPANGQCSNPPKTNSSLCNDGNSCTQSDSCQNGTCTGLNPVICAASDSCHAAGTCNPADGTCSNPVLPDGSACNDGIVCTVADACLAGVCKKGKPTASLCSDINKCTKDVCDVDHSVCKHIKQKKCNEPF